MVQDNKATKPETYINHRFLDEAGDTTFYGKGKRVIKGKNVIRITTIKSPHIYWAVYFAMTWSRH